MALRASPLKAPSVSTIWLSYDELSKALGITGPSVRNLVRRKRWPRQQANDGTTRVGVDEEVLKARQMEADAPDEGASTLPIKGPSDGATSGAVDGAAIEALALVLGRQEAELSRLRAELMEMPALRAQLAASQAAGIVAEQQIARLEIEAAGIATERDQARQERDSARVRGDQLADELRQVLQRALEQERARQERAARPWLRRIFG